MSLEHGTNNGYRAHHRRGGTPCAECKAAYDQEYRARPEVQRKSRIRARAQHRAIQTLVNRYRGMYLAEYEVAKGNPTQRQIQARQAVVSMYRDEYRKLYKEFADELFDQEEEV